MNSALQPNNIEPGSQAELETAPSPAPASRSRESRTVVVVAVVAGIMVVAILGLAVYALLQPETPIERWRDIFIIVVALETLVIGAALVVLLVQLASLINLVQNEIRPMLSATSQTVHSLRGTAAFLGESVVEPVIKLNGYLASMRRVIELMGIGRK